MRIDLFLNDEFKVLNCLCKNTMQIHGKNVSKLSQDEIAQETDMSKTKVNGIIKFLVSEGLVEMIGLGKYSLSDEAFEINAHLTKD